MGLIIPNLNGGYNKFGGGYMSDGKGNAMKIGGMYYADGKGNGIKIYSSLLPIGTSLYDGIPSNGMILYTDNNKPGSNLNNNPSIMAVNSIKLKNVTSQCPNGIQINFGSSLYYINYDSSPYTTSNADSKVSFPSIKISKGSSSGSVEFLIDSSLQLSYGVNYVKINANLSNNILTLNTECSNDNGNDYAFNNPDTELVYDYKTYNAPYFTIASITSY